METLRAMALMTAAMACFAIADGAIKGASATLPGSEIILVVGIGGALGFGAILLRQGQPLFTPDIWHRAVVARNLAEIIATWAFVTAVALTPLSLVSAIIQSTPLMVTLAAALVLGEPVGWRRWSAVIVGFLGVLIILRPGFAGFSPASLFAVLAAIGLATRDLASRVAPKSISTLHLSLWGFVALVLGGSLQMLALGDPLVVPDGRATLLLAVVILFAGAAVFAVTAAMRIGDVGAVSPFRYTRLVFGMIVAMVFFGERPDAATWIGAAIIVGSGLYVLFRERMAARAAR